MGLKLNTVWGIEIGANGFNAVELKKSKGNISITNFHVFPYQKSMENEDEEFLDLAKQGLMSLFGESKIKKNDNVFVSIPGRHIFSRPIELPPMDMRKFHELIKYEASQQIPHSLDDVVWDYYLDQSDENVSAILFAAHKDQVNRIIHVFKEAGLQIVGIQSSTLAILNYFRYDIDFDKSALLLDVKSKNIDFVINDGMRFWQRNIARGGDDINKALMTKFKIPFEQAEELKRNMSKGGQQAEKILQVVQPIFKSMTNEIQRSIGHYCNQHEESQIQDGFMLGNAHRMETLLTYFRENLRLKLQLVNKLGRLSEHSEIPVEVINANHGDLVVPLGLALQGLGNTSITVNLLSTEVIEERIARSRLKWLVFSAILFMIAGLYNYSELKSAEEKLEAIKNNKTSKGLVQVTKTINNTSAHIKGEEKKLAPVEQKVKAWRKNLRDRETFFKRDAWITAVDQLNKILYKPDADTDKSKAIYISELIIEKIPQSGIALPHPPFSEISNKAASKVFKITIVGSFYAKNADDTAQDLKHIVDTITDPLNAHKDYFRDMQMYVFNVDIHEDLNVPVCTYTIQGHFVPKPEPKVTSE